MKALRKVERKNLLKRITPIVGEYLVAFEEANKWTNKEISDYTGVHQQRLSECKHWNGETNISEVSLIKLVARGIVSVKKLKKRLELTADEERYLDGIGAVESEKLRNGMLEIQRTGIDIVDVMEKIKKAEDAGIDVGELIDRALEKKDSKG